MGMDLYSPQNKDETQQLIGLLSNYSSSISIGVTRIGTEGFWYSTTTGQELDYDIGEQPYSGIFDCLQLRKDSENNYQLADTRCIYPSERFVCELSKV